MSDPQPRLVVESSEWDKLSIEAKGAILGWSLDFKIWALAHAEAKRDPSIIIVPPGYRVVLEPINE